MLLPMAEMVGQTFAPRWSSGKRHLVNPMRRFFECILAGRRCSEGTSDRPDVAAVNSLCDGKEFTQAYEGLLRHYRIGGQKIQAGQANENGDVEQRHYRFKQAAAFQLRITSSTDLYSLGSFAFSSSRKRSTSR